MGEDLLFPGVSIEDSCCLTKIDVDEFCCVAVNENILYVTVT